jgi:hypothetical protein
MLDLRNLSRRRGKELRGGRDTSGDTSGDQGCTSKTHAVSITQVMWRALECNVTPSILADMQLDQQLPFPRPLAPNKEKRFMDRTLPNQRARPQTENAQQNPRTFQPSLGLLQQTWRGAPPLERETLRDHQQKEQFPRPAKMPLAEGGTWSMASMVGVGDRSR